MAENPYSKNKPGLSDDRPGDDRNDEE